MKLAGASPTDCLLGKSHKSWVVIRARKALINMNTSSLLAKAFFLSNYTSADHKGAVEKNPVEPIAAQHITMIPSSGAMFLAQ